jgi:RNA polymerase sigma factor for flagellar operon FliA
MPTRSAAARNLATEFASNPPMDIVRHAATRLLRRLPSMVRYDDLYSAGLTALVEASHRFDARRGVEFRTYAKHRVYGAMLDELRRLDTVSRDRRRAIREGTESPDALPAPRLVDIAAAAAVVDPTPSAEDELDRRRAMQRMRDAEAMLPPRLRLVLRLRVDEGWTLREIAEHLGVTEARACQLVAEVVRRLRTEMANAQGYYDEEDLDDEDDAPAAEAPVRRAAARP